MTRLEPETVLRNFLRSQLTDLNSNRASGAQWVFDDWPRGDLGTNSFPRIVVRKVSESGSYIGISDNTTWDDIILQIDVLVHRDLSPITVTATDEVLGNISNSPRLNFNKIAHSVTNIKHDGSAFGFIEARVNDSDFTSGTANRVQWSRSTGNLAFHADDATDFTGDAVTATYSELLEGDQLAKRIGRDIAVAIRSNWRDDALLNQLMIPTKLSGPSVIEFDQPKGWHRVMLEYQWKRYNTAEEL